VAGEIRRKPDGTFQKGVSGNTHIGPYKVSKAAKISQILDEVLSVPLDDLIQREDGKTNLGKLKADLQDAYEKNGLAYVMKVWLPLVQLLKPSSIVIDSAPKSPLRITLSSNGNGKHGGNGDGRDVIDVETK